MQNEPEVRIKSTLLSRPPRDESGLVSILGVMLVLFISLLCWRYPDWFGLLAASPRRVLGEDEFWRLFSAIGVHADLKHFLANALLLAFFAFLLYGYFGFWVFPVLVVVLGGLTNYFSLLTYPPGIQLVGASGVVYLMAGFWLTIYVLVERTRTLGRRLLRAAGITLIVLVPTSLSPGVSYRTHAIGFVIGAVAGAGYYQTRREQIRAEEVMEVDGFEESNETPWIN